MSLRSFLPLLAVVTLGCGGAKVSDEPTTAKEKQRREARANGEDGGGTKTWGGWRYKGDRNACFYSLNGRCFKTENAACQGGALREAEEVQRERRRTGARQLQVAYAALGATTFGIRTRGPTRYSIDFTLR